MVKLLVFLSFFTITAFSQIDSVQHESFEYKLLKSCPNQSSCWEPITDTTSLKKIILYNNKWVKLVYPSGELLFDGKKYIFHQDLKALNNAVLKNIAFIPETIRGYEIRNKTRTYVVIYGGMLGSTGISGSYSFIVIFNLNQLVKGKYQSYGCILKNFGIKDLGDINNDGILDLKITKTKSLPLN